MTHSGEQMARTEFAFLVVATCVVALGIGWSFFVIAH